MPRCRAVDSLIERINATRALIVGRSSASAMSRLRHACHQVEGVWIVSHVFDMIAGELHDTWSKLKKLCARVDFAWSQTWGHANLEYYGDGEASCRGALRPLVMNARSSLRRFEEETKLEDRGARRRVARPVALKGVAEPRVRVAYSRPVPYGLARGHGRGHNVAQLTKFMVDIVVSHA